MEIEIISETIEIRILAWIIAKFMIISTRYELIGIIHK